MGVEKIKVEEFSFALAVVLTPPVITREVWRLVKAQGGVGAEMASFSGIVYHGALGMWLSFLAGLVALRWLSQWLERGRWHLYGNMGRQLSESCVRTGSLGNNVSRYGTSIIQMGWLSSRTIKDVRYLGKHSSREGN